MIRYPLTVTPHTSLFIGGYARSMGESDGDTAADDQGMLIPGSAVKGALRESAVRLVNGAGRGHKLLERLFGAERKEGMIRVGPLRARLGGEDGDARELPDPSPRHHVSLERATRQAAPGRLFQNRVTAAGFDLAFRGELTIAHALEPDEKGLLESALAITDQLGGGRGRGLGLITVVLGTPEEPTEAAVGEWKLGGAQGTIVLELAAVEPLQLGIVKDLGGRADPGAGVFRRSQRPAVLRAGQRTRGAARGGGAGGVRRPGGRQYSQPWFRPAAPGEGS